MRLLFWTQLFHPYIGGIEVHALNLIQALRDRGHTVTVVTSHGSLLLPDCDSVDGIEVHRFRFYEALRERRLDIYAAERTRLSQLKEAVCPNITHVYFPDPSVLFHLRTQSQGQIPAVISIQIALTTGVQERDSLVRKTLCGANWTVAASGYMLRHARQLAPEINHRSSVIYNCVDLPAEPPRPLPFEPPTILCLGRVVRDKGFDVAVAAFSLVRQQIPAVRLVVAGDGPATCELQEQVARAGLNESVDFPGWIVPAQVPALLNTATIVLMPSRWQEAFGIVALQGMQMGRPVIASDVGGLPEVVLDGQTGFIVPKEDPSALASACLRLLSNASLAEQMGIAARTRAQETFSFDRHVDEYEALYDKLISGAL